MKSNYPSKIDTSVEIPAVRDNITEIGSDIINSLRSAIFNIEKTLGINPQGVSGNTVSERLAQSLDENGNIKPDALSLVNVLSGPIIDNDVSDVAAISESKLKLNFPTKVLQSELSSLASQIDVLVLGLEEVSSQLTLHTSPSALNRHKAKSIAVESASQISDSESAKSLQNSSLQAALEQIYSGHINFSSESISELNRSHTASQIHFDSSDVSSITLSNNVQDAIIDVANIELNGLKTIVLNTTSNGRIRRGSIYDGYDGDGESSLIVSNSLVTYTYANGGSKTTFSFLSTPLLSETISRGDLLLLAGSENEDDNGKYQIDTYTKDMSNNLLTVTVFGGPKLESLATLSASVYKNNYSSYNVNGLNSAVRPRSNRSNTPDVIVSNSDSATIITSGFQPGRITDTANSFDISIDSRPVVTISLYDSNVSAQSIDSAINKINEQCTDSHLNIFAYKIKIGDSYEIAISHIVPNFSGDVIQRTIEVSPGSTNDAFSEIGLAQYENITVEGTTGNALLLNGFVNKSVIDYQYFSGSKIQLVGSDNRIVILDDVYRNYGINIGDTVTIYGSSSSDDDGSFRISAITDSIAVLDSTYGFQGSIDENSIVVFQKNSARLEEMNFSEISGADGSILFDVFFSEDSRINYSKRLEVEGSFQSGGFYAAIVDVSKNFILDSEEASLSVSTSGFVTLTDPTASVGESVFVAAPGFYKIFSANKLSFIVIQVKSSGLPVSTKTVSIFGFNEVPENNYRISRGLFSTSLGRVFGEYLESGVPTLIDKRKSGTVDDKIISESFIERFIEGPRNELRASGVISGCEVSNVQFFSTYYTLDISPGVFVSNGIRHEFAGELAYRVNFDTDFYIAFDQYGYLRAEQEISYGESVPPPESVLVSPFYMREHVLLAKVVTDETIYDFRILVDKLDHKILKEVIVANRSSFGHFSDIQKAVNYSKNFSRIFPKMGAPSVYISAGEYSISQTIHIDSDILIRGAGPSTILRKTGTLALGVVPRLLMSRIIPDTRSTLFFIGTVGEKYSSFVNGVTIKDFVYETSEDLTNVGCVISISSAIESVPPSLILPDNYHPKFSVENISFIGSDSMFYSETVGSAIGEFAIAVAIQNDNITFTEEITTPIGNIIVRGCNFVKMGVEKGPVYLSTTNAIIGLPLKNITASTNIGMELSPNLNFSPLGVFQNISNPSSINVIETGNGLLP